jgi:Na+/melibiose symporter-like transporter
MTVVRAVAAGVAVWVTGYLALYLFLIHRSDATLAPWYVVLLLVIVALLAAAVIRRLGPSWLLAANALLLAATAVALATIGLLLVPALVALFVAVVLALSRSRDVAPPAASTRP